MVGGVRDLIPMEAATKDAVMLRFSETLSAVVLGTLLTGAAQGILGGIAYWVLGVPFALLLAGATAFLSLLPFGGPVVWIGVVIYFAIEGDYWRAAIMAAWGTLVIGSADNFIRPMVIGGRTQISDRVSLLRHPRRPAGLRLHRHVSRPRDHRDPHRLRTHLPRGVRDRLARARRSTGRRQTDPRVGGAAAPLAIALRPARRTT